MREPTAFDGVNVFVSGKWEGGGALGDLGALRHHVQGVRAQPLDALFGRSEAAELITWELGDTAPGGGELTRHQRSSLIKG